MILWRTMTWSSCRYTSWSSQAPASSSLFTSLSWPWSPIWHLTLRLYVERPATVSSTSSKFSQRKSFWWKKKTTVARLRPSLKASTTCLPTMMSLINTCRSSWWSIKISLTHSMSQSSRTFSHPWLSSSSNSKIRTRNVYPRSKLATTRR